MTHRTLSEVRAGIWGVRALRRARRALRERPLDAPVLPRPPAVPLGARRGLDAALGRGGASCLEAASVRQVWLAAHGEHRDLVIGVRGPDDFAAHAWLEGDPASGEEGFGEIVRRPSR